MSRRISAIAVAVMVGVCTPSLLACGDKFLVPNRGTRLQRAPIERRAAVLVYSRTPQGLSGALGNLDVTRSLERVGYRPYEVRTPRELAQAAAAGSWDVVLVSGADAASTKAQFSGEAAPAILPILTEPSAAEFSAAKGAYAVVIKAPIKHQAFLDAVDQAVERRAETLRKGTARRG